MSSAPPPGNPPGGPQWPPPPPPYGPYNGQSQRDYWRNQKAQNKAAWRAQRDAWKAQRALWVGNRAPSVIGPILMIGVGVVALLILSGQMPANLFWSWYIRWWPLILIAVGLALLGEWVLDLRRAVPVRRGGGYIGILILFAIVGIVASGAHNAWGPLRDGLGDNSDDFFHWMGQPEHDNDLAAIDAQVPGNVMVEVQNTRGDISITAGDVSKVSVKAHQVAYADSDGGAQKIFATEKPSVTVSGATVLVRVNAGDRGRTNLSITVPRGAALNVNAGHGDVTIAGIGGNVDATAGHGDLQLDAIAGQAHGHIGHGDFSAHQIQGDLSIDGHGSDLTISDIHGKAEIDGEYGGDIHLERIAGEVRFHSSRTDLALAHLPGDMSMTLDALHVTQEDGPIRVSTRSKDIELNQIAGDTTVEDSDGGVTVDLIGDYALDIKDRKGDVEIELPKNAAVTVDGHANNGDIVSDFPLVISGDDNKTIQGNIGRGGPRILLTTEHGDLRLHAGGVVSPASTVPKPPSPSKPPLSPGKVPHLKPSKNEATEKPVAQ